MREVTGSISIGSSTIYVETINNEVVAHFVESNLNNEELSAAKCLTELVNCLAHGVSITEYYNPTEPNYENSRLCKVKWSKSGRLEFITFDVSRKHRHTLTIAGAMERSGVFTCPYSVYKKISEEKIMKGN